MSKSDSPNTDALSTVYAQALLESAQENGVLELVASQVESLLELIQRESEFQLFLGHPVLSADEKAQSLERMLAGKTDETLYRFILVVNRKGRLNRLADILATFQVLYRETSGQMEVDAWIASEMDQGELSRIADAIGASVGKQVQLNTHIDESAIGGLRIKIGDTLIDATVATQLHLLKQKLTAHAQA